jgi:uncharacterized protein (DUF1015 family)
VRKVELVKIKPFRATILDPTLKNREKLICPVYDTIDDSDYDDYSAEKKNIIHFIKRKKGDDGFYDSAKRSLDRFFDDGILKELDKPSFYIYGIRYRISDEIIGQIPEDERRGTYFVFGLIALAKVDSCIVGHEETFPVNTEERYHLMKRCMMNFSPIVAEYNMPEHDINNIFEEYLGFKRPDLKLCGDRMPVVDVTLEGVRHLLWEISDEEIIHRIQDLMYDGRILILDGHHRYTASNLLRERDGIKYTLMMFLEGGDRGLLLLPWHRCIKDCDMEILWRLINENFLVESYEDEDRFYSELRDRRKYDVKIGMYDGKFYMLTADEKKVRQMGQNTGKCVGLDPIVLHNWLINPTLIGEPEGVVFSSSPTEVIDKVDNQGYKVAFILSPLNMADIEYKVYEEGKKFPQKSTRFLPKVAEGIVMRKIHDYS